MVAFNSGGALGDICQFVVLVGCWWDLRILGESVNAWLGDTNSACVIVEKDIKKEEKMNINTNINLRNRSKITLKDFKGLDTLSAPIDVSGIHATEMQNLISRDGVNHKRHGWKDIIQIRDVFGESMEKIPIRGIFNFTIFGETFLIAYAGKTFYLIDRENNRYSSINERSLKSGTTFAVEDGEVVFVETAPVKQSLLTDTECKFFMNGDKVYFVGCGDYLVFSKWQNELFELRRVVGNEDVYIPTTTEQITCEEDAQTTGAPGRLTAEEKNILSPYSKNTLFGKSLKADEHATYLLDQKGFVDLELTVSRKNGKEVLFAKNENAIANLVPGEKAVFPTISSGVPFEKNNVVNEAPLEQIPIYMNLPKIKETVATFEDGGVLEYQAVAIPSTHDIIVVEGQEFAFDVAKLAVPTIFYTDKDGKRIKIAESNERCELNIGIVGNGQIGQRSFTISAWVTFPKILIDLRNYDFDFTLKEIHKDFSMYESTAYVLTDKNGFGRITVDKTEGKIVIESYKEDEELIEDFFEPLSKEVPNITVKMYFDKDSSLIFTSAKAVKFGTEGVPDRLFVVDNTGNVVRWTKDLDFTYFGEKSWLVCGTADKKITGMDRLNDSTLIVVKEYSSQEPSIYVISGSLGSKSTEINTEDYYVPFSPKGYSVGMGAVGELVTFNGECLMVAKDGLYAVTLGENLTVDARYVIQRARQISNTLEKFDLTKAKCVTLDNKFYVYVGGEENACFVADNKYATAFGDDVQNSISYEWWRWTNIPVSVWGFIDNELCFGTEDGKICVFTDKFYDQTSYGVSKAEIGYNIENEEVKNFSLNSELNASKGDEFVFKCDIYGKIKANRFEVVGEKTRIWLPLTEYVDGEKIYIYDDEVLTEYVANKTSTYLEIDRNTKESALYLFRNFNNKVLRIASVENNYIVLEDLSGKTPIWATEKDAMIFLPNNNLSAVLTKRDAVIAKWVTGATNLGTSVYSKTLTGLILTGERDLINRLKYGIKTRTQTLSYEFLRANNDLDFEKLDLETLSLDSEFASTYLKRLNIRNVNFIMFYFVSDTAEDIALDSVEIEFKINKRNIGVR